MKLGARHCLHRGLGDIVQRVLDLTNGAGVDHVLDLVGGDNFRDSIEMVSPGGRVSLIGLLGAKEVATPTTPILLKAPVIQGIVTGHRRALEDLVRAIDRVGLVPVIDSRHSFEDLRKAFGALEAGAFGKVVIDIPHLGGK